MKCHVYALFMRYKSWSKELDISKLESVAPQNSWSHSCPSQLFLGCGSSELEFSDLAVI